MSAPLPPIPNQNHMEWILMGDIYGYLTTEDRRPDGIMPADCDPVSGLPLDQAPRLIVQKLVGTDGRVVEREVTLSPGSKLVTPGQAVGGVALAGKMTLWAGSDDPAGGPGTPGLAGDHISRVENGRKRSLSSIPRSQWTAQEVAYWREYALMIRRTFMYWATLNLVDPAPVLFEMPEPFGLDGLPRVCRPRWKLIELVRQVIPGTKWANRPHSILHDLTPSERLRQPQYARESFARETGGSVPTSELVVKEETSCPGSASSPNPEASTIPSRTTPPTPPSSPSDSTTPSPPASGGS